MRLTFLTILYITVSSGIDKGAQKTQAPNFKFLLKIDI